MGYLSQKKYKARENVFFVIASTIAVVISGGLMINPEFSFWGINLFYFYFVELVLFVFALSAKKWRSGLIIGIALTVSYVLLSISGNILFSDKIAGNGYAEIEYKKGDILKKPYKGALFSGAQEFAAYNFIEANEPILVIKVDLSGIEVKNYPLLLQHLRKFIAKQNTEVIVAGDFGMPAWSRVFRAFTEETGLTVKNRYLFDGWFSLSNFYVLGYNDMGIKDIAKQGDVVKIGVEYRR